jgi:hypothetical protein
METNLQFRLAARPVGMVKDSDWQQVEEPLRELADGGSASKCCTCRSTRPCAAG